MSDLKPCPFCGGEAKMNSRKSWGYRAECQSCDATAPRYYSSAKVAAHAWNTRATPTLSAIAELPEVRAMRDALDDCRSALYAVAFGDAGYTKGWAKEAHDKATTALAPFTEAKP